MEKEKIWRNKQRLQQKKRRKKPEQRKKFEKSNHFPPFWVSSSFEPQTFLFHHSSLHHLCYSLPIMLLQVIIYTCFLKFIFLFLWLLTFQILFLFPIVTHHQFSIYICYLTLFWVQGIFALIFLPFFTSFAPSVSHFASYYSFAYISLS